MLKTAKKKPKKVTLDSIGTWIASHKLEIIFSAVSALLSVAGIVIGYLARIFNSFGLTSLSEDAKIAIVFAVFNDILFSVIVVLIAWFIVKWSVAHTVESLKEHGFEIFRTTDEEQIIRYEEESEEVLVITDSLKFETRMPAVLEKIREILTATFHRNNNEATKIFVKTSVSSIDPGQPEPYKYRYLLSERRFDELVREIRATVLANLTREEQDKIIARHIRPIDQRYLDILRPFPERTYVLNEGKKIVICDLFHDESVGDVVKELEQTDRAEIRRFRESYNSLFGNSLSGAVDNDGIMAMVAGSPANPIGQADA
jgi:hypothetical protein